MKQLILFILLYTTVTAQAQFFYYPFPPSKPEYALNEKAQVKICYEYKLTGNEKSCLNLNMETEAYPQRCMEPGCATMAIPVP